MGTCLVCPQLAEVPEVEMFEHLRLLHPEVWADGLCRWPDGRVIVLDETLTPGDFTTSPARPAKACVNCDIEGCDGCWGADTYRRDDWDPS